VYGWCLFSSFFIVFKLRGIAFQKISWQDIKMTQSRRQQRRQRRDCSRRQQQRGGGANDVTNPSEYYGTSSGAYFQEGSAELGAYPTAYSSAEPSVNMFGNDIGPGGLSVEHSGLQTGGRHKQHHSQHHKQQKKHYLSEQHKKKKGGLWEVLALDVASKMAVPGFFFAGKEMINNRLRKKSARLRKRSSRSARSTRSRK